MKNHKYIFSLVLILFSGLTFGQSKIANINSAKLLEQIPELKTIQEEMLALQTQYQESLKQMESEMQKMQIALQQDSSSPKSAKWAMFSHTVPSFWPMHGIQARI